MKEKKISFTYLCIYFLTAMSSKKTDRPANARSYLLKRRRRRACSDRRFQHGLRLEMHHAIVSSCLAAWLHLPLGKPHQKLSSAHSVSLASLTASRGSPINSSRQLSSWWGLRLENKCCFCVPLLVHLLHPKLTGNSFGRSGAEAKSYSCLQRNPQLCTASGSRY